SLTQKSGAELQSFAAIPGSSLLRCPQQNSFQRVVSQRGLQRFAAYSSENFSIASPTLPRAVLDLFAPERIFQDGTGHVWLNKPDSIKDYESPWTVLGVDILEDLQDGRKRSLSLLLHRLKAIQQRVPQVNVIAVQQAPQADVQAFSDHLVRRILQHYVTFPVLVFYDAINKAALFEGAGWSPISCLVLDQAFATVAAYSLEDLRNGRAGKLLRERLTKAKLARISSGGQTEEASVRRSPAAMIGRGPDEAEDWPNLLLSFPSHITSDRANSRLFVSNALNHQVLILDPDGTILDVIGLSRTGGFQDGPFETAQLRRPGAMLYERETETLLIADVENHALRRADLRERTLTTVFPKPPEEESVVESLWSRLVPAFLRRPPPPPSTFSEPRPSAADEEAESGRPWFPWHIAMIEEGVLAVASAGYGQAWTVNLEEGTSETWMDGGAPNTIRAAILSLHATAHRATSLEADLLPAPAFGHSQISTDTPSSDVRDLYFFVDGSRVMGMRVSSNQGGGKVRAQVFAGSTESLPGYNNGPRLRAMFHEPAGVTELGGSLYIADTNNHRIARLDLSTGDVSTLKLKGFQKLGIPPQWRPPAEPPLSAELPQELPQDSTADVIETGSGRHTVLLEVIPPKGTRFASPASDWPVVRQARGTAVELSVMGGELEHKQVTEAQKWAEHFEDPTWESGEAAEGTESSKGREVAEETTPAGDGELMCRLDLSPGTSVLVVSGVVPLEIDSGRDYHPLLAPQPDLVVLKSLQKRIRFRTSSEKEQTQAPLRVTVEC
ncbi:hypothetical protein KFL_010310010, partial [Klebsormidium nitens]